MAQNDDQQAVSTKHSFKITGHLFAPAITWKHLNRVRRAAKPYRVIPGLRSTAIAPTPVCVVYGIDDPYCWKARHITRAAHACKVGLSCEFRMEDKGPEIASATHLPETSPVEEKDGSTVNDDFELNLTSDFATATLRTQCSFIDRKVSHDQHLISGFRDFTSTLEHRNPKIKSVRQTEVCALKASQIGSSCRMSHLTAADRHHLTGTKPQLGVIAAEGEGLRPGRPYLSFSQLLETADHKYDRATFEKFAMCWKSDCSACPKRTYHVDCWHYMLATFITTEDMIVMQRVLVERVTQFADPCDDQIVSPLPACQSPRAGPISLEPSLTYVAPEGYVWDPARCPYSFSGPKLSQVKRFPAKRNEGSNCSLASQSTAAESASMEMWKCDSAEACREPFPGLSKYRLLNWRKKLQARFSWAQHIFQAAKQKLAVVTRQSSPPLHKYPISMA